MANNRGVYDPRQFLHYPEKDPFSDAAQARLDGLIKDFLSTGIAFVNGAGVRDIDVVHRKEDADLPKQQCDDASRQEQEIFGNGIVTAPGDDEVEEFGSRFSRVDKGKGRDEREGPGLKGLWSTITQFSPGHSSPAASVNDGSSFLTDNGSLELEGSGMDSEDRDGFFEGVYENEETEELEVNDEKEDSDETGFVPGHSHSPGSEQEIICIGDSDEENESLEAASDLGSNEVFGNESQWYHGDLQDDDHAPGADLGSGSVSEEATEERQELDDKAWDYNISKQYEDNIAEPEWHQSQGKESDDEDGGFITGHGELEEDERDEKNGNHSPEQPRRFFTSASRKDPWENLSTAVSELGTPVLFPAHWGVTSFQQPTVERQKDIFDHTEDIPFDSVRHNLGPDLADDAEANEQGPPPEWQHDGHMESSFTRGESDLARMAYHPPIPKSDLALSEHSSQSLDPSDFSSGASLINISHAVNDSSNVDLTHYSDLPTEPSASQNLGDSNQAFRFSPSARNLSLDPEVHVTQSLDVSQVVSATHAGADLHMPESTSAVRHSIPGELEQAPQPTGTTLEEQASQGHIERSAATVPPTESFLRGAFTEGRISQEPVNPADLVEKSHDTEENKNISTLAPSDAFLPVELHPLQAPDPLPDVLASQPLEPFSYSSPFAEEDSNEDLPKPVLLHPAVFDDQIPTHTEEQSQSPTSAVPMEYADYDVEIYDMVEDVVGNEVVARSVSEHVDDSHKVQDVPLETLETEEVTEHHTGDVFPRYVVSEAMSEISAAGTGTDSPPAALKEGVHRCGSEGALPSISAPTISVGSNTPPLSPTATVTNSSSAPDPSIATSDLSTVNQASVSVVTSTGSPPAIHVPRVSATHADIRQPVLTYVGYASDEDHMGGDGVSVLPDPRLPPEPTHLGIPVGVVGRSLGDDKEERAESMKVEPPRSESEGGSMVGEARNTCEAEGTSPTIPAVADEVRECLQDVVQHEVFAQVVDDEGVSMSHVDQKANESANIPIPSRDERLKNRDKVTDEAADELVYPDPAFDHLSTDGDEKPASQPVGVDYPSFVVGESSSRSPPASPTASKSLIDTPSSVHDIVAAAIPSIEVLPEPSTVDLADRGVGGHLENLKSESETSIHHKQNGTGTKQHSHSSLGEGLDACDVTDSRLAPSTPSGHFSPSPTKSRKSARGKSKTIAADSGSVSPPPPPQSTIYAHTNRSPALQKRLRPSDPPLGPSKYPRLTLSAPSKSNGDATWASGALDDKSDVSSIISSASAVSRLLVQRGTSSSPSISSRSTSIKSQLSPTTADHFFMLRTPIRRYVPHKHNASPTNPRRPSVERASSEHQSSVSPSPASPSGPSFVPPTSIHQTRASCTDHKISIPGPDSLLYFLVPRCSLLNPEVEKDVNIVDCGVATKDEVDRAIGDLEAVNLDSTTLGVIRQLAGIQLMREGQVGYLPDESRKHVKHASSRIHNALPTHGLSHKLSLTVPFGAGSSQLASYEAAPSPASVSDSVLLDMSEAEIDSPNKLSKASRADDEAYKLKLSSEDDAASDVEEESFTPLLSMSSPPPKSVQSPRVSGWRRRKLKPEDVAYKPEVEAAESSSDDEVIGGKKKGKRASKRKSSEAFIPGDGNAGNLGTPKKKRKRKDVRPSDDFDEPLDGSETRRKQVRRKKVDDRHAGDHVATAL